MPRDYNAFYQDKEIFPDTLKNFVEAYYNLRDYSDLVDEFRKKHIKGQDQRHNLWIRHIKEILATDMVYPDGHTIKVKKLPLPEILRLIDYFGYQIGLAGYGHGNDTLLAIFKKYFKSSWLS